MPRIDARLRGMHVSVGEFIACARDAPAGSIAFASPKSSTLTVPSGRTLMFAGFRSRWTIPCSCAASSASAICLAIGSASASGIGPWRNAVGQRRPLDQFHHQRESSVRLLQAVDVRDVRMVQDGEDFGFALEPREPLGIRADVGAGP